MLSNYAKLAAILVIALAFVRSASALTLTFSGVIDTTSPTVASEFPVGSTFELEYTIPEPVSPSFSSPGFNNTYDAEVSLSAVSEYAADTFIPPQIAIANDSFDFNGNDAIFNEAGDTQIFRIAGTPGFGSPLFFRLRLSDTDSVALSSNDIEQPIAFSEFETRSFTLLGDFSEIVATGTIVGLTTVPEPSTAILGLSALMLGFRRKR